MQKNKLLFYLGILLLGLAISFILIEEEFNIRTIGFLIFLLIFIPTLIKPDIGLIIIIISMLFSPDVSVGRAGGRVISIRIEDILLLVVILAWLTRAAFTKDIARAFKTRLTAPFFLYIAVCIVSTILASIFGNIDIKLSFFAIFKYLEYFLLFLMVKDNIRSLRQIKIFVVIFLLTALMVAFHSNIFIQEMQASGAIFFRTAPPVETRRTGESGTLGGYLIFMMAITGGLLLYTRSVPIGLFLICLEALMFRSFLYTLSRGSYLALIPMVIALVFFSKKFLVVYILLILSGLTVIFMPQMVKHRITSTVLERQGIEGPYLELEESPKARLESWKIVLFKMLPKSPIFGHGVARFFIDSQVFSTLGEVGLLGFTLLVSVLLRLFKIARDILNLDLVKNNRFSRGFCAGFLAGFIGLLVHAISTNTFIIIRIMEPFWFMAAIVLSLPQLFRGEKEVAEERL